MLVCYLAKKNTNVFQKNDNETTDMLANGIYEKYNQSTIKVQSRDRCQCNTIN